MLQSLHIENIAVIKKLDIDFDTGLTVFTGETGAGKSIIIDSIRLLLGSKADKGIEARQQHKEIVILEGNRVQIQSTNTVDREHLLDNK